MIINKPADPVAFLIDQLKRDIDDGKKFIKLNILFCQSSLKYFLFCNDFNQFEPLWHKGLWVVRFLLNGHLSGLVVRALTMTVDGWGSNPLLCQVKD